MQRVNVKTQPQPWIRDASQDRQPEIHSTLSKEDFQKDYGADQQRLQSSDLHFDKFTTPGTSACCSQFPTEAMLWIKEVEMVESVYDLKSSRSFRGTPGPDFELLDARIASALNRIIQNTRFKRKVSLEEMKAHKEDGGQGMGSPKQVRNRRRRTREGPENACVQTPLQSGWHTQEEKDELTSCRGSVQSAWQKPPVRREGGRAGLPKKGKWPPRGTGTTVLTYPGSAPR